MKEWFTAQEIAGMNGMPGTDRNIRHKAHVENWKFRKRAFGKGREYHIKSMPEATRKAIISRKLDQMELPGVIEAPLPPPTVIQKQAAVLKDWQKERMDARAALLHQVEDLALMLGIEKAIKEVVSRAREGALPDHLQRLVPIANAKGGGNGKRTLSSRTIKRWRAAMKEGVSALAPKPTERAAFPPWGMALLKVYRQPQNPSLKASLKVLSKAGSLPEGVKAPTYTQARSFLARLGEVYQRRGRMGPRELQSIQPFVRRDTSEMSPGDCYSADGHTFDAEVAHPIHGKPFRPEITLVIDVATRKAVGWSCTLAESALATLDALRHASVREGIPSIFYVDRGPGYNNDLLKHQACGLLARMGTTITHSIPYNSQARGLAERGHQTIWVRAAKKLPTYMGEKMDPEAKQIAFKRTRATGEWLLPWEAFCKLIDREVWEYNHNHYHSGLAKITDPETGKRRYQSPQEAWDGHVDQGWSPAFPEDPDSLFRPQEQRKIQRGEVRLFGGIYFSKELAEYHGCDALVGYDVWDPARVWVHDLEGALICTAEAGANKAGYFPKSMIEQARETRAKTRRRRLETKLAEVEAEGGGPAETEPTPVSPAEREAAAVKLAELEAPSSPAPVNESANGRPVFFTDADKFRWLRANKAEVTGADREWADDYKGSDEYRLLFGPDDGGMEAAM
ncbi:MAG: DDE-type integrase/transposase/recombinase [Candidatus Glassbacteria bacterium]|nr:DDE-type integrase/transposase/recombinase [Candidatus Glassbacteria bacterium]